MEFLNWLKQAMVVSFRVLWNLVILVVFGLIVSDVTTAYIGANFVPFCLALFIIPLANTMFNEVCDLINEYSTTSQERRAASERALNLTAARAYSPLRPQFVPRAIVEPVITPVVLQPNAIVNQEDEEDTPEDEIARAMLFRFFLVHTILQRQLVQQNSEPQEDINVNEIASLRPN